MKVGGRGGDVIEKIGHWYLNWKIVQKKQRGERDEEARRSSKKLEEKEGEREKERQRERVDGRNVEKLHPAHCIEIQEKERLRQKRDDGAEGSRRKESEVGWQGGGWRRGRARRGAFLESSGRRK